MKKEKKNTGKKEREVREGANEREKEKKSKGNKQTISKTNKG